jgi:chorismate--pyruvate lyase
VAKNAAVLPRVAAKFCGFNKLLPVVSTVLAVNSHAFPCYDAEDLFALKVAMSAEVSEIWQAHWRPAAELDLALTQRDWLLNTASLTARLKALPGDFSLQLRLETSIELPNALANRWRCATGVVREVVLKVANVPCVYAQSFIPTSTVLALTPLAALGDKPLGEFIFQQPSLARGDIEVAEFAEGLLLPTLGAQAALYGRRSLFTLDNHQLLVQELFLPGLFDLCSGI